MVDYYGQYSDDKKNELFETAHGLWSLLETLTPMQLDTLSTLLAAIGVSTNPKAASNYYTGYISAVLSLRHGICPTCESVHDGSHDAFDRSMAEKLNQYVQQVAGQQQMSFEKASADVPSDSEGYSPAGYV